MLKNKVRYLEGHIDKVSKGHCQMSEMKKWPSKEVREWVQNEEKSLPKDNALALWACELLQVAWRGGPLCFQKANVLFCNMAEKPRSSCSGETISVHLLAYHILLLSFCDVICVCEQCMCIWECMWICESVCVSVRVCEYMCGISLWMCVWYEYMWECVIVYVL